ncbi:MAG: GDP-L-fucose synthase [Alphaproteobacteria bacterium]|nr:GDP-L-fucose synthase [Alphaproteobacteria bacterium]
MKIYISGSTGMVGRNIIENIDQSKYEIITSQSKDVDLTDFYQVKCFLEKTKPDMILHTAGKVGGIQANIKDSFGFYVENILMGVNLIKASVELGIKKFFNLSSSCSYPFNAPNPLTEDLCFAGKLEPTNEGYAIAKASILRLCEFVSRQYNGFLYKTAVPCNLYGRFDKFGEQNSHMIPAVIKKLHYAKENNIDKVEIWGDGLARREFMFATDFAQIICSLIDKFDKTPNTINVGLGYDYTVNEYYETVANVVGYTGTFTHDLSKPAGMKQKLLDVSKQTALGLKAKHSLKEGVEKTYQYYLNEVL